MTQNPRWKHRPLGSTWGDWGPDDELGRLNLITPTKVKQGVAEVREGITFNLSLPLDVPGGNLLNPRRKPPRLRPTTGDDGRIFYTYPFKADYAATDVVCDDAVLMYLQYSTQWDSFAHMGSLFDADGDGVPEPVFYNGYRAGIEVVTPNPESDERQGAHKLGLHAMAAHGVQGRGVLIDVEKHFGTARQAITYAQLRQVMEADHIVVEPGDMVCIHTGFAEKVLQMNRQPDRATLHESCAVLDANDPALLQWITDSQLSVLIADNYAVEDRPHNFQGDNCRALLPLHEHCLFKLGVHLGEIWHLTPLAHWLRQHNTPERGNRFLLTAPPLRLPGAVGAPPCPVATV